MVLGQDVFTRQQLAVMSQVFEAIAAERIAETDPRGYIPATVQTYDVASRMASVIVDGSDTPIPVFNRLGRSFLNGDRVFVEYAPPSGAMLAGIIKAAPPILTGCVYRSTAFPVPNNSLTVLAGLTKDFDPFGLYNAGVCTIPTGMSGLWSASAAIYNAGTGFSRVLLEIIVDGFSYRDESRLGGGDLDADPIVGISTGPIWMPATATVRFNAYQTGPGSTVNFLAKLDLWQVQPGTLY